METWPSPAMVTWPSRLTHRMVVPCHPIGSAAALLMLCMTALHGHCGSFGQGYPRRMAGSGDVSDTAGVTPLLASVAERVASAHLAAPQAGGQPLNPLSGRAMGEAVRDARATRLPLQPVVADRGGRVHSLC